MFKHSPVYKVRWWHWVTVSQVLDDISSRYIVFVWLLSDLNISYSYSDDAVALLGKGDCVLDALTMFCFPLICQPRSCYTAVHINCAWPSQLIM